MLGARKAGPRFRAERRVKALAVVDGVDEPADIPTCVERGIGLAVHLFSLEGLHEALGLGVVIGVPLR